MKSYGKKIWVDSSFCSWLSDFEKQVNAVLPEQKKLDTREASKLIPLFFKGKTLNVNLQIVEQRKGKYAYKRDDFGSISKIEEFKL